MEIIVNNLIKYFNQKEVIKGINLTITDTKIYCLIGPNGAGKTTLLRILNLLEKPTSGCIKWDNKNLWNESERERLTYRRKISLVHQFPILFNTTVFENVAYPLRIRRYKNNKINEKINNLLDKVSLTHLKYKKAYELSGGEKQRLAIIRALAIEPEILFLDEPTANLDPYNVILIEELIKKINKENNTTIVLATHNIQQAKRLSDKVSLLVDGRIVEEGLPSIMFNNPQSSETRNFIEGKLIG